MPHRPRRPQTAALLLALAALLATGCVALRPHGEARARLSPQAFLALEDRSIFVERWGPADGEPVVLVHGFGASSYSFRRVAPALAEAGFAVTALDLYGFGWSDRPEDAEDYTPAGQARLVAALLDGLGLDRAHVVGHSFGGGVALLLAEQAPERVRSLVLVDSTLPTFSRAPQNPVTRNRPLLYALVRTFGLRRLFVRAALEKAFHDDAKVTGELVDAYRERLRRRGPAGPYLTLTAPIPGERLRLELEAIDRPTLVVWGEEDALIPVAAGRLAAEKLPAAEIRVLPDCGHVPMEECPEAFLEVVLGFLREVAPGG